MPSDAMMRKNTSVAMFGANAHAAVPIAYIIIVSSSVRVRPEAIGDAAENDAADRPANQQQRCEDAGPLKRRGSRGGGAERNIEQHGHRVRRHVVEEQAVENIEAPSQPGGKQHRPLVGVHVEQCPSGRNRHGVAALSSLDHEIPFRVRRAGRFKLV